MQILLNDVFNSLIFSFNKTIHLNVYSWKRCSKTITIYIRRARTALANDLGMSHCVKPVDRERVKIRENVENHRIFLWYILATRLPLDIDIETVPVPVADIRLHGQISTAVFNCLTTMHDLRPNLIIHDLVQPLAIDNGVRRQIVIGVDLCKHPVYFPMIGLLSIVVVNR
jgi:hypothetical protein